ncbi:MAG: hypothetical protein ABI663_14205 [Chryseolinea sp.]
MLLAVFVFQMVGYYFVYLGLRFQANTEMAQRLDIESYTDEETITIKIPFTLPYWSDSKDFERVNGEFVHNGEFYKLVKQELRNDTLHVVCIHDFKEKRNFNFMAGFAKLSADAPVSSKQALKLFGSLLKDFVPSSNSISSTKPLALTHITYASKQFSLIAAAYPVLSPPPDFIS